MLRCAVPLHDAIIRFSDSEAARVKSASKLVSTIGTSSTSLQEGIFNMACKSSPGSDEHCITQPPLYSTLPDLLIVLLCIALFEWQLCSTVLSSTATHQAG